jgi:hypothetical protein
MAKSVSSASGFKERKTNVRVKSDKPQKLSKVGEWMGAHPSANGANGVGYIDGPDSRYIDPADYPDTTAYLNALPGVAERLLAYRDLPDSEFKPVPRNFVDV